MSGCLLDARDIVVNKTDKNLCPHKAYNQVSETDSKKSVNMWCAR